MKLEPQCPVCARPFSMETTTTVSNNKETSESITRVNMKTRAVHDNRGRGPKDSRGWSETLVDMEVHVLAICDGTNDIQNMLANYIGDNEENDDKDEYYNDEEEKGKERE